MQRFWDDRLSCGKAGRAESAGGSPCWLKYLLPSERTPPHFEVAGIAPATSQDF